MLFRALLVLTILTILGCNDTHIENADISPPVQIPAEGVEVLVRTCGPDRNRTYLATKSLKPEFCYNHYHTVQEAALAVYPGAIVDWMERQIVKGEVYYFVHLSQRKEQ